MEQCVGRKRTNPLLEVRWWVQREEAQREDQAREGGGRRFGPRRPPRQRWPKALLDDVCAMLACPHRMRTLAPTLG